MFEQVVQAVRAGRSPLLFTGIEGDKLGKNALWDREQFGDPLLIPSSFSFDRKLPVVENGVLIERIVAAPELILCGAGHVSVQTAKVAKLCGFSVTVIDEREDFANRDRFGEADRILNLAFDAALEELAPSNAYYVIVTRGHRDDRACLERILQRPFCYCGMIGSRTKVGLVFDHLLQNGYSQDLLKRVHAPIGLAIGAVTPEEIAVSIVGELIQVKNGGTVGVEWDEALCHAVETLPKPYAMVTLVSKTGSAPRATGARMIVQPNGTIISSIGGGFGEYEAVEHAKRMLCSRATGAMRYTCHMTNDDAAKAGMICGGTVDVLIQIIRE